MAASCQKPKIILCGEAFGENEDKIKRGFVGTSGAELLRMLNESGIIDLTSEDQSFISKYYKLNDPTFLDMVWALHPEVHRTNVLNLRPPRNDLSTFCGPKQQGIRGYPSLVKGKHLRAEFIPELERLASELEEANPNLTIALGNTALWALSGSVGISKLRGTTFLSTHTATGYKCLATYHPAAIQRQWELRPVTIADLMKAKRESAYPEIRRTKREIWIEPTLEDMERFYGQYIIECEILSTDIETSGNRITCIGFSPKPDLALVIPFYDTRRKNRSYWRTRSEESIAWTFIKRVLEDRSIPKVFQNGLYDISFLWRSYGIKTFGAEEDTMLLHHALQPESLKSLGFLGSVYADESAWKQMRGKHETIKGEDE